MPKLSVFITNYNHGPYVRQSVDSVLSQTYRDFELILIDDGSTDGSAALLEPYRRDPRVTVECFVKNRGAMAAIARAMELVTGEYLFGRAADDFLIDNAFFGDCMKAVELHPEIAGVFAGSLIAEGQTMRLVSSMGWNNTVGYDYISPTRAQQDFLDGSLFIPGASSIWKRSLVESAGGFDPELGPQSDFYLNHMLALRHGIVRLNKLSSVVREFNESFSSAQSRVERARQYLAVERKIRAIIPAMDQEEQWERWRRGYL